MTVVHGQAAERILAVTRTVHLLQVQFVLLENVARAVRSVQQEHCAEQVPASATCQSTATGLPRGASQTCTCKMEPLAKMVPIAIEEDVLPTMNNASISLANKPGLLLQIVS